MSREDYASAVAQIQSLDPQSTGMWQTKDFTPELKKLFMAYDFFPQGRTAAEVQVFLDDQLARLMETP